MSGGVLPASGDARSSVLADRTAMLDSPSPGQSRYPGRRAYELKFLVTEECAREAESWAHQTLQPDCHASPELNGAYRTATLYLDNESLDTFYRTGRFASRKYRLRRYGDEQRVFVERKTRRGNRVGKRRDPIGGDELELLADPTSSVDSPACWFHRTTSERRLLPSCIVRYVRRAFVGCCPEGPLRLTLDRDLHGSRVSEWSFAPANHAAGFLPGFVVLELKFCIALPAPFKALLRRLQITSRPVSKYRRCLAALGVGGPNAEVRHA